MPDRSTDGSANRSTARSANRSDLELMLALQAGDEEAFAVLVKRHMSAVLNLAYRYLGNRADADDLAQEIFMRVHRARKRYRPEAKFTTWLYRVAANACLNEVRSRKSRPTHGAVRLPGGSEDDGSHAGSHGGPHASVADTSGLAPEEAVERAELHAQVRAAVDALPERQRMALLMNKFHGLGYEELATALDLSIPAVKSLLVRARENVRGMLEPYLTHGEARLTKERGTA